jgi:hypothetical protein
MIPIPLIAFPIALLVTLLLSGGTAFWGYEHGLAIQEARQTKAELVQERQERKDDATNIAKAQQVGGHFEEQKPQIIHEVQTRTQTITIPPDADPFVPVWFVRMFDRLASADSGADTYPGQSAGDPSRTRLSGVKPVLEGWVTKYETCRKQIVAIGELKPVLPKPPEEDGVLDKLNPFR